MSSDGLESLPTEVSGQLHSQSMVVRWSSVQLLYEIQSIALSDSFPLTSRYLHGVFRSSTPSFRARYLLGRVLLQDDPPNVFTKALRYSLCIEEVLDSFCRQLPSEYCPSSCDLPRRLFRSLAPRVEFIESSEGDHPLPFLRYLYQSPRIPAPDTNAHDGYALTKAVHAKRPLLIQFLLERGASPACKNGLAVSVAIRQKDLQMVKLLIEQDDIPFASCGRKRGKRRKLEDRLEVNREMLKTAVRCGARDIVDYLTREKGCIPDIETLNVMTQL